MLDLAVVSDQRALSLVVPLGGGGQPSQELMAGHHHCSNTTD
jgi:hypothetical protein